METNLFAWIPTLQRTASSIHLESGQNLAHTLFLLSFMLICYWLSVIGDISIQFDLFQHTVGV